MRTRLLTVYMALCFVPVFAAAPSTPSVVETYYRSVQAMSDAQNESDAYNYRTTMQNCFIGTDNRGINVPNDFYNWGYNDVRRIPSNTYAIRLQDLCYNTREVRLKQYNIVGNSYVSEVDLRESRTRDYIQTIVSKTFSHNGKTETITDTVLVEKDKIVQISNRISSGGETDEVDISVLRAKAAAYYTSKRYKEAYMAYERIISLDPNNANAYYRLGLMTFWRQGCKLSHKEARRKAIEYERKAYCLGSEYDDQSICKKADKALYYMEHPQTV